MKHPLIIDISMLIGLLTLFVGFAWGATCDPIADAFRKLDKQERVETRLDMPLLAKKEIEGEKRIGSMLCSPTDDVGIHTCEAVKTRPAADSMVAPGKAEFYLTMEKVGNEEGRLRCEPAGAETLDGEQVNKYVLITTLDGKVQPKDMLWVSSKTGLPVVFYSEEVFVGRLKFVYGAAVKDCHCKKK